MVRGSGGGISFVALKPGIDRGLTRVGSTQVCDLRARSPGPTDDATPSALASDVVSVGPQRDR
jgi:hypothetical protein